MDKRWSCGNAKLQGNLIKTRSAFIDHDFNLSLFCASLNKTLMEHQGQTEGVWLFINS